MSRKATDPKKKVWKKLWSYTNMPTAIGLWFCGILGLVGLVMSFSRPGASRHAQVDGLPDSPKTTTVAEVSAQQFASRILAVRRDYATEAERCRRVGVIDLGLAKSGTEANILGQAGWVEAITGGPPVTAFYVTGTDTVYTRVSDPSAISHEMVHAYDDQTGSRLREADIATTTDEALALRAIVEGSAIWATGGQPVALPWGKDLDRNALVLAYGLGPIVAKGVAQRQGPSAVMKWAPKTTAEVLTGTPSEPMPVPGIPEGALCTDRLGSIGVLTAMIDAGAGWLMTKAVYESWLGDRVVVRATPTGSAATWTVIFDDSAAAKAWSSRVGTALPGSLTGSSISSLVVLPTAPAFSFDSSSH